jgi:hypothetical protein
MFYCRYIIVIGAVLAACGESPTASRASAADLDVVVPRSHLAPIDPVVAGSPPAYVLSDDAPPDLPPEFQESVWLDVRATASFEGTSAKGSSIVDYLGTNATAKVILKIRKGVQDMGVTPPAEAGQSHLLPWRRKLVAETGYSMAGITCGHSAASYADGSAWNEALLFSTWFTWGKATKSAYKEANQSPCPSPSGDPAPTGGGSGGGDSGDGIAWEVCYYTAVYENGVLIDIEEHGCVIFSVPALI